MRALHTKFKIAGCVVLYNPDEAVLRNIDAMLNDVELLHVVDNTDNPNDELVKKILSRPGIQYHRFPNNIGMSPALNLAARLTHEAGFDFLLTMDQDSWPEPEMVSEMLAFFNICGPQKVGMLAPNHVTLASPYRANPAAFNEVLFSMTSGCLLNLDAYKKCGPFMDKLFIDYVDVEYGLRLKTKGYSIIRANNAILHHGLGSIKNHCIPCIKKTYTTNHSALRLYYLTRNMLAVHEMYRDSFPHFVQNDIKYYKKRIAKIILFENDKIFKLHMCHKGYAAYKRGVFGKLQTH